jgi:MFS family permease
MAFGTSKNLPTAITIRFAMGLFNGEWERRSVAAPSLLFSGSGAVGVARSAVQGITDPTNESRAFTYMGLAWGLGGIVGSIIGGLAENPVSQFHLLLVDETDCMHS